MVRESSKDRTEGGRDRTERQTPSRGRNSRSDMSRSERDRSSSSEAPAKKRLRNEGESRKAEDVGRASGGPSGSDKPKFKAPPIHSSTVASSVSTTSTSAAGVKGSAAVDDGMFMNKKDVYEKAIAYENLEARRLNTEDAIKAIEVLYNRFDANVQEIKELKMSGIKHQDDDEDLLEDKMSEGLMIISSFRRISRLLKLKLKFAKEELLSVRNEVDTDHLLLQNLLYEATHVQSSVAAVQEYKGKDSEIELIPVQEFLKEAPESLLTPAKDDPHLMRIARLEYEYVQRDKLQEDLGLLEKEKELTVKSIQEKQEKFDSVLPLLKKVLEATRPVQDFFQIDVSEKKEQNSIAHYLPPELYVLLVQSNGYKEAAGPRSNLMVRVCGNVESAKEFVVSPDDAEEDSDSDKEPDPDVEVSERRLLRKKSSIHISPEESRKKLVQKYPLWVEWVVKSKDGDCALIQFFYLIKLRIVTVKAKRCANEADLSKPSDSEISTPEDILTELMPNDDGKESPNPSNSFMFSKVDSPGIEQFINETGKPYRWAQKLAGIEFPDPLQIDSQKINFDSFVVQPNHNVSSVNIERTLKLIRSRLNNQTKLWSQLKVLESRNIQIPPAIKDVFPVKMSTTFKAWEPITWLQYSASNFTEETIRLGCVTDKHMFYKATLERGRATVVALVAFSQDFPSIPPVFCVQLEQDGERRDSENDVAIRDLEKEVNIYTAKDLSDWSDTMATLQIQRLIQCTDIILETDFMLGESAGPSEFGREKLFLRAAAGRNLRRPFKFHGAGGGYFSQRY